MRPIRLKTLDELEDVVAPRPSYPSHLVQTCYRLRSKPIGEFDVEDLRIMIGQNIGLPYLIPLALDQLERNPWASGDMYPGDLLRMAARAAFAWHTRVDLSERMRATLERALSEIPSLQYDEPDGMPNLDVPDEELAQELTVDLEQALERLKPIAGGT